MAHPFPVEIVEWLDPVGHLDELTFPQLKKLKPVTVYTVGFLVHEDDICVRLVTDCHPKTEKDYKNKTHTASIITKGCIVSRTRL